VVNGVEVAVAGGWGLIQPEKPDPYFRIAQKNVVVAAWNIGTTSAAFGDIDGDGRPELAVFGYTLTGVGWNGPPAGYIWLQPAREKSGKE
jgi:hypothetical protein